mgnify:CR=1 FL=1
MRRSIYFGVLTAAGLFLTVTSHEARQTRAPLALHEVATNLYLLANDPSSQGMGGGGNTAIFLASEGVVLVDTKISGYGPDIMDHVRELTDTPVTTIINTHTHWEPQWGQHRVPRNGELCSARKHGGTHVEFRL